MTFGHGDQSKALRDFPTRRQLIEAVDTSAINLRIISATVNHNRMPPQDAAAFLDSIGDDRDRLDKFITTHRFKIRQDSQHAFTEAYGFMKPELFSAWLDDLENHFASLDAFHEAKGRNFFHTALGIVKSLTHYRKTYPGVMTTVAQEAGVIRLIALVVLRHDEIRHALHCPGEAYNAILLNDPEFFRLVARHPGSADDIFDMIVAEGSPRAAIIEARLNGLPRSPLNVGAL